MPLDDYKPDVEVGLDRDKTAVWLGMEVKIPDKEDRHDPDKMESKLHEWTFTFLQKGLANAEMENTGKGVDLIPRDNSWDLNPLYVRYMWESWFDKPEDNVGRIRKFMVWFPVNDFMEHHELDALKDNYTYIIGDEVYDEYEEQIDVAGVLIAGSEESVRQHINQGKSVDVDIYDYM